MAWNWNSCSCSCSISLILSRTSWKTPSTSLITSADFNNQTLGSFLPPLKSSKFKSYCSYSSSNVPKDQHNHNSTFPLRWLGIEERETTLSLSSLFCLSTNYMLSFFMRVGTCFCILSFLFAVSAAHAYECEDVANYYAPVSHSHLEGEDLKRELNLIISTHHSLSYKEVWDALEILDAADVDNPDVSSEVVEVYSLKVVRKTLAGKPEGWNREHLWPRSYGLVNRSSRNDVHNIRPSDVNGKLVYRFVD